MMPLNLSKIPALSVATFLSACFRYDLMSAMSPPLTASLSIDGVGVAAAICRSSLAAMATFGLLAVNAILIRFCIPCHVCRKSDLVVFDANPRANPDFFGPGPPCCCVRVSARPAARPAAQPDRGH